MANDGKIFRAMIFVKTGLILIEDHVQNPMNGIFDPPMIADHLEEAVSLALQAGNVVAGENLGFLRQPSFTADHDDGLDPRPVIQAADAGLVESGRQGPTFPDLNPVMALINRFGIVIEIKHRLLMPKV